MKIDGVTHLIESEKNGMWGLGEQLHRALRDRFGEPGLLPADDFSRALGVLDDESPLDSAAVNDLGRGLFQSGNMEAAAICHGYAARDERALGARVNLGQCELALGRTEAAAGHAEDVLRQSPGFVPGWLLRGAVALHEARFAEAAQAYATATELAPDHATTWWHLGMASERANQAERAVPAYRQAFMLQPDHPRHLASLVAMQRRVCDWTDLDTLAARLRAAVAAGTMTMLPIDFLAEGTTAEEERDCAERYASRSPEGMVDRRPVTAGDGILRIGFVSAGFGAHPTSILVPAVIEAMRRPGAEIHLFATSVADGSALRDRMEKAGDLFHDMASLPAQAVTERIRSLRIDVLVDLDGYCRLRRPDAFALRAAPVQMGWLGYPGTTGASFMDYVLADAFVVPPQSERHYAERVVRLPRCYQATDPTRHVADVPSRPELGLPEDAFVFVCFNASFKLNPRSMQRMFRILRSVQGSVLWLMTPPGDGKVRLEAAADRAGVSSERLIFAPKSDHSMYLGRYRHADLFLDTEQYNAHTTASDALWAGCPVLTRPGETFATRVAGSINHYLGMGDFNADEDEAFVAAAVRYAGDPGWQADARRRLAVARGGPGFFDARGFADDFMALARRLATHNAAGGSPGDFPPMVSKKSP